MRCSVPAESPGARHGVRPAGFPAGAGELRYVRRNAEHAAEAVVVAALRIPRGLPAASARTATASRAALGALRHPEGLVDRAKKLPMAAPMIRQAVAPIRPAGPTRCCHIQID